MKRSEMIDHIYAEIVEAIEKRQYSNEADVKYWRRKSEGLLDMMQGFGMQPPNIKLSQMFPKSECQVVEDNNYWYGCWEPEDETSKQNKLKPTPLTDEELADVIANDEDLQNETK